MGILSNDDEKEISPAFRPCTHASRRMYEYVCTPRKTSCVVKIEARISQNGECGTPQANQIGKMMYL
ncbi:hypothetical protein ACRALDRAFT_2019468 [Sodiomyces alcalophilus JCM 7366]|uniref:uncharacterized protein n=1 Tax=Sodiomyces alcalophilus JCM 7366 TaxID=591952 RepID=UPI0039B4BA8E